MTQTVTLIISGGIAAYKSLELIRLLRKDGITVLPVLTNGGAQFVTPLSVAALAQHPVYTDLWSLKDESEMGHIRLSRDADLVMVAPASADLIAKMAHGLADDLASTLLLASNKPVMISPAMNGEMWNNPATQRNIETLKQDGIIIIPPAAGDMACGETGEGRMPESLELFAEIKNQLNPVKPLAGKKAIVTSGPTFEAIDPVRYIGNRSSGKQGHAIAAQLARAGADVTLISGPVNIPAPRGIKIIHIQSAAEMQKAVLENLPADIAVCAAAVADWGIESPASHKMKKRAGEGPPALKLVPNPDILAEIGAHKPRPTLIIGFAAETEDLIVNAKAKLLKKACDWIIANQVGIDGNPVFGQDDNQVTLLTHTTTEDWPAASKMDIARRLVVRICEKIAEGDSNHDRARPAQRQST
ncbi:MAG: bifunctional phosphopantothenoylcysteine decarboxylase/phosphopantothenate--cysteine ligase CoaBC [Pseudobdellovibrionaceae bacterium]